MSSLPTLRDILNNTPANAIDVDWNFDTLVAFVAQELINRDGTVAMAQPLTLAGPAPSAPNHAATKSYVDQSMPRGVVVPYAGATAPAGWALCDGASKSTTDPAYAALFAVIGYTYGGSGANFNLPDLRGKVPLGKGGSYSPTLGAAGGRADAPTIAHTHSMGNHTHDADHNHSASSGNESADHVHSYSGLTAGDAGHDHPVMAGGEPIWFFGGSGTLGMDASGTGHSGAPSNLTLVGHKTGWMGPHNHNYGGNTQGRSAAHTHAITVNTANLTTGGPSTNTTGSTGEAAGTQNLPPFQVLNYIIRIGV